MKQRIGHGLSMGAGGPRSRWAQWRITLLLAALSVVFSLLVLNRWLVTDAGIFSYGRVWQLFVSYSEFGFVRRGLVGSLLSWSGLNGLFDNEYVFAYLIHGLSVVILASLVCLYVFRHEDNMNGAFKAMVFLSPAFIIQLGYTSGSLDVFMMLTATVAILFTRGPYLFSLLSAMGVLIHEAYLFMMPALLLAFYRKMNGWDDAGGRGSIATLWLPGVCVSIASILVLFFGRLDMPMSEFKALMEPLIPNSPYRVPRVGSGYYELSSGVAENAGFTLSFYGFAYHRYFLFLWVPLLQLVYLGALGVVLARNSGALWSRVSAVASVLFPLLASFAAGDVCRWIGMSANMSILLLLLIAAERRVRPGGWAPFVILPFTALAPFGSVAYRPFPVHQFVIERLLM